MKICITIPGFSVHGGIRILLEWANRLDAVILDTSQGRTSPDWFNLNHSVKITKNPSILKSCDVLIIGSPHGIDLQDHPYRPKKVFIFLQMMEHMFRPEDKSWEKKCMKFYTSPHPMILGASWNYLDCKRFGRSAPTYYIGNGVNMDDFPICNLEKDGKTVLIESPISSNPVKDTDQIALQVARRLDDEGYRIIGYGAHPFFPLQMDFVEYYKQPSISIMNKLYSQATILIKATHYDARALAPVEAMTKGTVTARAIDQGDDDLFHEVTALRSDYDIDSLYRNAKRLLEDNELRNRLSKNCLEHVQKFSWDFYMKQIKDILLDNPEKEITLLR